MLRRFDCRAPAHHRVCAQQTQAPQAAAPIRAARKDARRPDHGISKGSQKAAGSWRIVNGMKSISDPSRQGRVIRSIKNTVTGELDLTREVEYARKAALAAGGILMRYYGTEYEIGSKGKNNPVTIADTEADAAIKAILTHA